MVPLTVIIPAKNEEKNIDECIRSVLFCNEIIVLNSGTDQTAHSAKKLGAKVVELPIQNKDDFLALQKNINAAIRSAKNEWILRLDADERVTAELQKEITHVLADFNRFQPACRQAGPIPTQIIVAFGIPRKQYFLGGFLKGGDWAYDRLTRLFKKDSAYYDEKKLVHEQFVVSGKIGYLKNSLLHYSHPNLQTLLKKFNSYTTIEAGELHDSWFLAILKMIFIPPYIFLRWMIWHKGYRDGLRGVLAGMFRAGYDFMLYAKYLGKKIKAAHFVF